MNSVAIVGFGKSAQTFHLPLINSSGRFTLAAIATSRPDRVRETYPAVTTVRTVDELVAHGGIDLVIITSRNHDHFTQARTCLEHGIPVVLEKPMVTTVAEAEALVRLSARQSTLLTVFQNRRWDGDFLTVRKLLADNTLGKIRFLESHFDRFRPDVQSGWREQAGPGNGLWFDLGPHLVDQAVCLFGLPRSVTARCLPLRDHSEATDYFHVQLHYPDLEVVLHASPFSAGPRLRFRIEGTRGCYVKYGLDPQEGQLRGGTLPSDSGYGVESSDRYGTLFTESGSRPIETEAGCYQEYYHQVSRMLAGQEAPPVSCEEAITVMRIIEAADQSQQHGMTVELER